MHITFCFRIYEYEQNRLTSVTSRDATVNYAYEQNDLIRIDYPKGQLKIILVLTVYINEDIESYNKKCAKCYTNETH